MSDELVRDGAVPVAERTVEVITVEILGLDQQAKRMALDYAVEIGRRLVEVKGLLHHGEWGPYLAEQVHYSHSTANNFMKLFEEFGDPQYSLFGASAKSQTLGNLSYTKALALLMLPGDEREAFARENDVEEMSTRELKAAIKAREEAEAKASNAEQARDKMAEDMKFANERLSGLEEEKEKAIREAEASRTAQEKETARLAALEKELEELRSRPVDVDPAELEAAKAQAATDARKEAEEKLKEKLDKAKQAAKDAEARADALQETARAAQDQAGELRKKLAVASDREAAMFQALFETTQEDINKMAGVLEKMALNGAGEKAGKLRGALRALLEAALETVG